MNLPFTALVSVFASMALIDPALAQSTQPSAPPIHTGSIPAPDAADPAKLLNSPSQQSAPEFVTIDPSKPFNRYYRIKNYPQIPILELDLLGPPPAPGQKLIEWNRQPILDYEIPVQWRGMNIACGETSQNFLSESAATCAPILDMAKRTMRLEFAVDDATTYYDKDRPRAEASRREALDLADAIIVTYAQPEWPLQYKLLSDTYRMRSKLYEKWGEFDAAIADQSARIKLLEGPDIYHSTTSVYEGDFTSSTDAATAYWKKGELLLAKKDHVAAQQNYDEANEALVTKDMFVIFSPVLMHAEMMAKNAIFTRNYGQALTWIDRYLQDYSDHASDYGRATDFSEEIKLQTLISYKLYILADQGKREALLETLALYQKTQKGRGNLTCRKGHLFPQVLAPFHKDPAIHDQLKVMGCNEDILTRLDDVPSRGVYETGSELALPPHQNIP